MTDAFLDRVSHASTRIFGKLAEESGKPLTYSGIELTPDEVSSPDGVLPLVLKSAIEISNYLDMPEFAESINLVPDPEGLLGVRVDGESSFALAGLLILEVSKVTDRLSSDDAIDLSVLEQPFTPEVFNDSILSTSEEPDSSPQHPTV